jgi:hypothetical protein
MNKFSFFGWAWLGSAVVAMIYGNDLWAFAAITNSTVWLVGEELDKRWSA